MYVRALLAAALLVGAASCGKSGSGETGDGGSADGPAGDDARGPDDGGPGADGSNPDTGGGGDSGGGGDGGWKLPSGREYPDTWSTIALLVDQLPQMNMAQMQFATSHLVGTEKQVLSVTQQLRQLNPNFLVLHYHLCLWQSGPMTPFICDGMTWCNDYPTVTMNESWFWHNANNERVVDPDMALLMNVSVAGFAQYWEQSLEDQVSKGDYDGIMFDSASPSLLQGWVGGNGSGQDPRLAGTAAKDTPFAELGNVTWIQAWQTWIAKLDSDLWAKGIPLIPNDGAFITGWDDTDYTLTRGVFSEGFADPSFAVSDWKAATNYLLKLASLDRLMILQDYLNGNTGDVARRLYYLGNYLLVKGHHTYLDYFANGPLEWYPEWAVDLGAPTTPPTTDVSTLMSAGVYRRDFAKGSVLVNPTSATVTVNLGGTYQQVVPSGGGAVDPSGTTPGTLSMQPVTSVDVGATTAVILLK